MSDLKYKKPVDSNYLENNSDRTSLIKDRVIPNLKTKALGLSGAAIGGAIGAGAGFAGRKLIRTARKKILSPETTQFIKDNISKKLSESHSKYSDMNKFKRYTAKPAKLMFSDEMSQARNLIAGASGGLAGAGIGKRTGEVVGNTNRLRELYRGQFGVEPSESEIFESAKLNPRNSIDRGLYKYFFTPEAVTKSTFRNARQMNNIQYALDPKEINPDAIKQISNGRSYHKLAYENTNDLEKQAININDVRNRATNGFNRVLNSKIIRDAVDEAKGMPDGVKKIMNKAKKPIEKFDKHSPVIGSALGSAGMIAPAMTISHNAVPGDDENRKLKRRLIEAGMIGTGAVSGGLMAKNIGGLTKSLHGKAMNPNKVIFDGVDKYMSFFKESEEYFKSVIEKVANNDAMDIVNEVNKKIKTHGMDNEKFQSFADRMNNDYRANSVYQLNNDMRKSYYLPGENVSKMNPVVRKALDLPDTKGKGFIRSVPLEEVMLHETGHAVDKGLAKTNRKANIYKNLANGSGFATAIATGAVDNKLLAAGIAAGGTGLSTGLKYKNGKTIELREDNANKFVEDFYTKKFGDRSKAIEHIKNNTVLPKARKTYSNATKINTAQHALLTGLPSAYSAYRKFK